MSDVDLQIETVAVVGVGLIGGSFGLAIRKAGFKGKILGVSSPSAIDSAISVRAIDQGVSLETAVCAADLIYLAQPVDRILQTINDLSRLVEPDKLVTDAGSTKAAIVQQASESLPPGTFIGGHPMAGKETRGASAAEADLFRGRPYVLTKADQSPNRFEAHFRGLLSAVGARVLDMTAMQHDSAVALTSHLPQLISTALAGTLALSDNRHSRQVFGPGLLDMTRLALSAPDLWMSILDTNRAEVTATIDAFSAQLNRIRSALLTTGLESYFTQGAEFAAEIRKPSST